MISYMKTPLSLGVGHQQVVGGWTPYSIRINYDSHIHIIVFIHIYYYSIMMIVDGGNTV